MMTGFLLRYDSLEEHGQLNDEQYGRLIRAALKFARDGTEPELPSPECYLWPGLRLAVVRDQEQYRAKCLQNTENINKRWEQYRQQEDQEQPEAEDTNVYDRIRTDTNDTNINIKINHKINNNDNINHQDQSQSQSQGLDRLRADGYTDQEIERAISRANGKRVRNMEAYIRKSINNERQQRRSGDYSQRDYSGVQAELEAQQDKDMEEFMRQEKEGGQP